ncbi:MAG: tetratricopeptide repeat protein, partial [Pirellulales bacterium]
RKFAKRNRTTLAAGALLAVSLLVALGGIASGIGWAVRDRAAREEQLAQERTARQARVAGQLEIILDEVARLEQAEKWSDALVSARRAEPALAAGEAASEIQKRVRQALADLELVRRLDEIRAQSGMVWGTREQRFIPLATRADQDYSAAFREAGIDVDTLPVEKAAEWITARGQIAAAVLPALDDWVAVRSTVKNEAGTRRLIDVLRTADPDPWRQQVRECLARQDWQALETLARSPDLDRQPAATISFLSGALRSQAESDTERPGEEESQLGHRGFFLEIDILRRAQRRFPADYWINRRLGTTLIGFRTSQVVQEGIGYMRVAIALRPQDASNYNNLAWFLVTSADDRLRHSEEAVKFAERAVELGPHNGAIWNTLGVAQYRAGQWNEAIEILEKSLKLQGDNSSDFFFLAMAYWQLGNKDQARQWFDKATEWMDKNASKNEELLRFRAEATELLGIAEPQSPTRSQPLENEVPNTENPTSASPPTTDN